MKIGIQTEQMLGRRLGAGWPMLVVSDGRNMHLIRYPSRVGRKLVSRRKLFRDNALRINSLDNGSA